MKSTNQITLEVIESANAKVIAGQFYNFDCNCADHTVSTSTILELVAKNSNDFTADIAKRAVKTLNNGIDLNLSAKQAWCIAYQVVNNIEVYKVAMAEYNEECANISND